MVGAGREGIRSIERAHQREEGPWGLQRGWRGAKLAELADRKVGKGQGGGGGGEKGLLIKRKAAGGAGGYVTPAKGGSGPRSLCP